ncbi:carboxypeptidase-like regulatory domain-containing protein [Salinimicrobium catena]|uniref:TonB-dependent receptor n=1 Tax=Salinimicrobium catena TaxID=390640 RepID=UPI002FE431FE
MKNSSRNWLLTFFFTTFLFCCGALQAQEEEPNKVLLKELLPSIEEVYEVRFSYREQDLAGLEVTKPQPEITLQEVIDHLESQTLLNFEVLDERYIAITYSPAIIDYCGIIVDSQTGEPLQGATVQAADGSDYTVTNANGKFLFSGITEGTEFIIRFLGYRETPVKATAPGGDCSTIFLEPSIVALQEAIVVNYLTSGISKKQDGSTFINTARFGTLPGQIEPDVLQTVEALPGVESVNETVSNINIRGGTSDQNLVLFDGIKMYLTGHFFGLISAFNPNLTSEVLVTKNGSSARLSDGVSGTIEIFSKDQLSGKFAGGVGINLVSADAFLQVPVSEKLELQVSGRRSINDFVNTPTYNNYFSRTFQDSEIAFSSDDENFEDSNFSYYDTSLKLLYDLNEAQKFRFSLMQVHNELGYTELNSSSEETRRSNLGQDNLALGGTWKADWRSSFSTEAITYLTHYRLEAMNHSVNVDQRLIQENEVLETGFKLKTTKTFTPYFQLLSGYQFSEVGVSNIENLNNPFFSSTIKNVIRNHAVYAEGTYSGETTFLRGGLRLNYISKFKEFLVEPRLSFNQELGRKVSFKALAEIKSQTTSQIIDLQEDFLGVENRRWILADNETYPIIKSKQVSAGFDFKARGWYLDLEAYYKFVEGISTSNQGFQDQHEFIRTSGSYTAKGFEVLINKKTRALHTYLNYTFGKNDYTFEELTPSTFPNNFDIRHSVSLAANYSYRNFKFSAGGYLRSGKPYTRPVEDDETRREGNNWVVNYATPNAAVLPSFFRVDLSSSYKMEFENSGTLTIGLGIQNLLDRKNIINRYYRVNENSPQEAVEVNNTSLGFTPNASLRFSF